MRHVRSDRRLRDQEGQGATRRLVEGMAERVDRLGSYLEESDANSLLDELDRLGRRSPATVMAGGVVVGVLMARFLKASSGNRSRQANGRATTASTTPALGRGDRMPTPEAARRRRRLPALHARDDAGRGRPQWDGLAVSAPAGEDLRQKPIAELVGQLGNEISTLVRQEMELAKVTVRDEIERASDRLRDDLDDAREEMTGKARHAGKAAALGVAGAVAAILALGTLTAFLVLALDGAVDAWLAALIVGLVWAAVTAVLVFLARAEARRIGSVGCRARWSA